MYNDIYCSIGFSDKCLIFLMILRSVCSFYGNKFKDLKDTEEIALFKAEYTVHENIFLPKI